MICEGHMTLAVHLNSLIHERRNKKILSSLTQGNKNVESTCK